MGRIFSIDGDRPEPEPVARAADALRAGGLVLLPTDTVYGIAQAVAANPAGPVRLLAAKHRPRGKTVAWLVGDREDLDRYGTDVPAYAHTLARRFWPGGLTLVVRASDDVVPVWRRDDGTIALRMPDCAATLAVIRATGCPLATSSANTSGLPAAASADDLEPALIDLADVVLDGRVARLGVASTVVVCTGPAPVVVREGAVSTAGVFRVAGYAG